jgi:N-acetyl-gamma-glutamyl-phosphate reductase
MVRIGILGGTGYTALELLSILLRHPHAKIVAITSRQPDQPPLGSVHPRLEGRLPLTLQNLESSALIGKVDCVFSCLPHAASAEALLPFLEREIRVIDLSADFRLWNPEVYRTWYGEEHPAPKKLGEIPYGLPELYRDRIRSARCVANPGCYPTSAILAMAPLLRNNLIEPMDIILDSKSGVSGAGRTPKLNTHFPECNEAIAPYGVGKHRHTPEIAQILSDINMSHVDVLFTPHLVPMDRGILTTGYARLTQQTTQEEIMDAVKEFYQGEVFVRVVDRFPSTKDTAHTNYCDLSYRVVGNRVVSMSCLDNLIKGASGAAVQNFNLMFGFPETTALEGR